ncbi:MAG: HDOD domain-containing protein [Pontibacterium sp.]
MSSATLIKGLGAWAVYLNTKTIPVRSSAKNRLLKLARQDSCTLQKLTQAVQAEPAIAFHVVRLANRLHKANNKEVTSINHAVQSLGFETILETVNALPTLRVNISSVAHKMYFRCQATSLYSACLLRRWMHKKETLFLEELYQASLCYGVGHWLLWLHAPLHMSEIHQRVRKGEDPVMAESDVLGCSIQDISLTLMRDWEMPALLLEALEHKSSPSKRLLKDMHRHVEDRHDPLIPEEAHRELIELLQSKYFPVKLSNWYGISASLILNDEKTERLVTIISGYTNEELDDTRAQLNEVSAIAARICHYPATLSPAAERLFIASKEQLEVVVSEREEKALHKNCPKLTLPEPPKEAPETTPNLLLKSERTYKSALKKLKSADVALSTNDVLKLLIKGLRDGVGTERNLIMLIKNQKLKVGKSYGFTSGHPLTQFKYSIETPSLLKRLAQTPACIMINLDNSAKMKRTLPEAFRNQLAGSGTLLLSLFANDQPIAIIHGDNGNSNTALVDIHHQCTKKLCIAANNALQAATDKPTASTSK